MVIMILEKVPVSLRGDLSRWMIEPKAGIFLGSMTARIRDELWKKALKDSRAGSCFQAWRSSTEQGFQFRTFGDTSREMVEFEGLHLVSIPTQSPGY